MRRAVTRDDVQRIVSELSPPDDNSAHPKGIGSPSGSLAEIIASDGDPDENAPDLNPGLASTKPVETTSCNSALS